MVYMVYISLREIVAITIIYCYPNQCLRGMARVFHDRYPVKNLPHQYFSDLVSKFRETWFVGSKCLNVDVFDVSTNISNNVLSFVKYRKD